MWDNRYVGRTMVGTALGRGWRRSRYVSRRPPPLPLLDPRPTCIAERTIARTRDREVSATKPSIELESVDFCIKRNTRTHHTDEFDITLREGSEELVVRRGQPFVLSLTFNKPYDESRDDVRLLFTFGENPRQTKGTRIEMKLSDKDLPNEWGAKIDSKNGNTLTMIIFTPPDCYVGVWEFKVDVIGDSDSRTSAIRYDDEARVYILFNPWCKDDLVYLNDETSLNEYVLNETGRIYVGNSKKISPRAWNFGQFEGSVLDCAVYLLEESTLASTSRGDPVKVVRKLSAMVNCQDDKGVLIGNWSGDYGNGTAPTEWNGSVKILEEYYKTKEPVAYGQCWVYSGLLTSVCRALGIPARSVTNFASAHDTDDSTTIDQHYDSKGEPLEDFDSDSIWNFHVWNDVWMARPDLPHDYGGWQAIDATPQETSEGTYQCGPTSLVALKQGEVNLPYDGKFLFAEVNADIVCWQLQKEGTFRKVLSQKGKVGKHISTKSPVLRQFSGSTNAVCRDSAWWEDVTSQYKYEEGSPEERAAVIKASAASGKKSALYADSAQENDVKVSFLLNELEYVQYGEDYEVSLLVKNDSSEDRRVGGCLSTTAMYYTGVPYKRIKIRHVDNELVPKGESISLSMKVTFDDYFGKLMEGCHMKLSCQFRVIDTEMVFTAQDDFRLLKPDLTIKVQPDAQVGKVMRIDTSFVNPLNVTLTQCRMSIEGPGLQEPLVLPQQNVNPKQTFMTFVNLKPRKAGKREFIATFTCKEMSDVQGSCEIEVAQ